MALDCGGPSLDISHYVKVLGSALIIRLLLVLLVMRLRGPNLLEGDIQRGELQLDAGQRVAPHGLPGGVQESNVQEVRLSLSFRHSCCEEVFILKVELGGEGGGVVVVAVIAGVQPPLLFHADAVPGRLDVVGTSQQACHPVSMGG